MKTMTEIVDSIKNEKLKAVARDLQIKLENAKNAIVQKRSSGEKVTRAESSALKTSALGYVKKGLSVALVTAMLTTMLASCDELQGSTNETGTGNDTEITDVEDETYPELEMAPDYNGASLELIGLNNIFKELDFAYLYYDTEGRDAINENYDLFIEEADKREGSAFIPYMGINDYHSLTSEAGNRQNVVWELDSDRSAWSHELVSTNDDFALISKYKSMYFVTGFVNGKLYDDTCTMGSENYNSLVKNIKREGYLAVMNAVRDEFWGKMYNCSIEQDDKYLLITTGTTSNMLNDDGIYKHATEFTYRIDNVKVLSQKTNKILAEITPTYDIPDNYIDQFIENKNYGGNHGRPHGNNNHWQDGEFVPGKDGANNNKKDGEREEDATDTI